MAQVEKLPTLLVVYDVPAPMPLHASRPVGIPVGVGLLIRPDRTNDSIAAISIAMNDAASTICDVAAIEQLRNSNPAARSLPLLQAIAKLQSATINIALSGQRSLKINVQSLAQEEVPA